MMNLLAIGGANMALKSATQLVHELKTPRVTKSQFAALLEQQLQTKPSDDKDLSKRVNNTVKSIMKQRDANGDGVLTFQESGFTQDVFQKADLNGDGKLSTNELQSRVTQALQSGVSVDGR